MKPRFALAAMSEVAFNIQSFFFSRAPGSKTRKDEVRRSRLNYSDLLCVAFVRGCKVRRSRRLRRYRGIARVRKPSRPYSTYVRNTDSPGIVKIRSWHLQFSLRRGEGRLTIVGAGTNLRTGELTGRGGGMRFTRNCRGSASAINFDALIKRSRFEPTRGRTKTQRQRASERAGGYGTYVCT